jgi:hypothetical protein
MVTEAGTVRGIKATARRFVLLVLVCAALVGALGIPSAKANHLPPHWQTVGCIWGSPQGRLDWTPYVSSFYAGERVWVYPTLYWANPGGNWNYMRSPMTDRYYYWDASIAGRTYGTTYYVNTDGGFYYALKTYYYWPRLGIGVWEWSNSCYLDAGVIIG